MISLIGQQTINGLVLGTVYGLIAIGYTMVYGIIGMINFAHGEVYMIAAYLAAIGLALATLFHAPLLFGLFFTLLFTVGIAALYGWTIERIAYRPLRHSTRLAPLISAIGMSMLLQNFVRLSQGARTQAVPVLFFGRFDLGGDIQISYIQSIIIVTAIISMILLTLWVNKTTIGRAMRATQQDLMMAAILGVSPNKIISLVFVTGSMMAAIAGMLVTFNYGSFNFTSGFIVGIKAFTSAVLGGIGSLPGAMLGGLILGMSETLFAGFINGDYKDVFAFLVLIGVLVFKPSGLLGTPDVEKV